MPDSGFEPNPEANETPELPVLQSGIIFVIKYLLYKTRNIGLEPITNSLKGYCSTIELITVIF